MAQTKKYSQIRALLAVTGASIKAMLRNPSSLVFGFLFPLIFIVVFGFIGNRSSSINVGIMNNLDKDNVVYNDLSSNSSINFKVYTDKDLLDKDLAKGSIDATLDIQKTDIGPKTALQVNTKTTNASPQAGGIFLSIINGESLQQNLKDVKFPTPPNIIPHNDEVSGREYKTIDFILPGQLGFSLLSLGTFSTAFLFLNLRQTLVLKRFFSTPIYRGNIVLGEAIARLIFALMQASLIIFVGYFFFHFTLINGFFTFLNMLVISFVGLVVFMGFGFIISSIAKDENTLPPLANIVTLPQFLLAGTFFPIESFPTWLQPISRVLPLTYMNDAMRKVAFEGASLWDVRISILVLIVWGIVTYAVAIKFFKWE